MIDVFERRFSVDETVRRHKPAPEAYHSVAAVLEADPGNICLIACHAWDTLGAAEAGWQAGLILRAPSVPGSFRSRDEGARLRNRCRYGELDYVVERTAVHGAPERTLHTL